MAVKERKTNEISHEFKKDGEIIVQNVQITKRCFIITPIGSEDDPIRRHIEGVYNAALEPVLRDFGYHTDLPHKILTPGSITRQIVECIYNSDLIIVNLTGINPNVMYELALAHCFNKPMIIIAEKGTKLPFDIINERTLFYDYDPEGVYELQTDLRNAMVELREVESFKSTVVSYVKEYNFDKNIKDDKDDNSNEVLTALRTLSRRIDRIDYTIRNTVYEDKNSESTLYSKSYRIVKPQDEESDFETEIKDLINSFRNSNINVMYRFWDDFCSLYFRNITPKLETVIEFELREFCNKYNLGYIKI